MKAVNGRLNKKAMKYAHEFGGITPYKATTLKIEKMKR
jgi:hypothetical protein